MLYLLKKQYKVSSWQPSVDIFFEHRDRVKEHTSGSVSDWVGEHVLNIWVNNEVDESYLRNIVGDIALYVRGDTKYN